MSSHIYTHPLFMDKLLNTINPTFNQHNMNDEHRDNTTFYTNRTHLISVTKNNPSHTILHKRRHQQF